MIDSSFKIIKDTFELTKGKRVWLRKCSAPLKGRRSTAGIKKRLLYLTLPVYSKADSQKVEGGSADDGFHREHGPSGGVR